MLSQKEWNNFWILIWKERGTQNWGGVGWGCGDESVRSGGVPALEETMISIFYSKERHKRLPKRSRTKQALTTFPLYIWIFSLPDSVSNVWIFCLGILSSNLSSLFMHSDEALFCNFYSISLCLQMQPFLMKCFKIFPCQLGRMDSSLRTEGL